MTKREDSGPTIDPFEAWRQVYDTNERTWSAALEQAMGSAEFGESSGKLLETMLAAQKSVRDNMRTYLETMNVPTREDIARLGELVVGLEEKIDQVGDRLDAIEDAVRGVPSGPAGPAGPVGPTGHPGTTGPTGPAGRTGPIGKTGRAGPAGRAGSIGKTGRAGPSGPAGRAATARSTVPADPAKGAAPATPARTATRARPAKGAR
jgi:hypothetical protein